MRTLTQPPVAPMELLLAEDSPHDTRFPEMGSDRGRLRQRALGPRRRGGDRLALRRGVCAGWPEPSSLKLFLLDLHRPKPSLRARR